jgi:hypothetical protein
MLTVLITGATGNSGGERVVELASLLPAMSASSSGSREASWAEQQFAGLASVHAVQLGVAVPGHDRSGVEGRGPEIFLLNPLGPEVQRCSGGSGTCAPARLSSSSLVPRSVE